MDPSASMDATAEVKSPLQPISCSNCYYYDYRCCCYYYYYYDDDDKSLQAAQSGVRNPVGERDSVFSIDVQIDPGAHRASCTMGTRSRSQG